MQVYDTIISGCGPVGALLANLLRDYGHQVAIFDREKDIFYAPRAMVFDDESLRILQGLGLLNELQQQLRSVHHLAITDKDRNKLLIFDLTTLGMPYGYPIMTTFHQPRFEQVLRRRLSQVGVDTFLGWEVLDIKDVGTHCQLLARNTNTNTVEKFQSRYVIGCDGATSLTRKIINTRRLDLGYSEKWIVMDTMVKDKDFFASLPETSEVRCSTERAAIYFKGIDGHVRFDYVAGNNELTGDTTAIAHSHIAKYFDPMKFDIVRVAPYTFYAGMPESWRQNRLLLAGDAAHQTPPFAGQGLNMGFRDAVNIAFKLHLVLTNKASDNLLDTYQQERQPVTIETIRGAILGGKIPTLTNPILIVLRNFLFFLGRNISIISKILFKKLIYKPYYRNGYIGSHRLSGHLMIQPKVQTNSGKDCFLDDLMRQNFVLLSSKVIDRVTISQCQAATGMQLLVLGQDFIDKDGVLQDWFANNDINCVLVRPDKYIYSAGNSPTTLCNGFLQHWNTFSKS